MIANTIHSILEKVQPITESGCWVSDLVPQRDGYCMVAFRGKKLMLHRVIYEQLKATIPDGYELDHICRVRCCVNPDHLEVVTPRENTLRSKNPAAIGAARETCIYGHIFDGVEKQKNGLPRRKCSVCMRARYKKYNAKRPMRA